MNATTYFKTSQAIPQPDPSAAPQVVCPSTAPLVLLPVRLETRFIKLASGVTELRVRIYPDKVHIDSHQPELTSEERARGAAYWQDDWKAGADAGLRGDAWRTLAIRFGAARAAWIARTLRPTNMALRAPAVAPIFPTLPPVGPGGESAWRRAPMVRMMPDRWVAVAHANGKAVLTATGKPVRRPLAVGPDPQAPKLDAKTEAAVRAGTTLPIDPGMLWLVDFDEAERAGMALRMIVPPELLATGFESLVVFGAVTAAPTDSAAQLADLLDAHSYTDGLEFLRFGAPTNNTEERRSDFSGEDPDHQKSFQNEVLTNPAASANAARVGKALGLPTDRVAPTLGHIGQATRDHDADLRAMNTALWPVGWGYYLSNMVGAQTGLSTAGMDWARTHFQAYVRGGGPYPALRFGRQPYGLLPVTSLDLWAAGAGEAVGPQDAWLKDFLRTLRDELWRRVLDRAARIGLRRDPANPDADLADAMAVEALSHGVVARRVLGAQYLRHLHTINGQDPSATLQAQATTAGNLLRQLRLPDDPAKRPRIAAGFYEPGALSITAPLVQAGDVGPAVALNPNYIQDLLKPATIAALAAQPRNTSLLEALLRHGLLREYAVAAARMLATTPAELAALLRDPELVDLVDQPRDNFVLKQPLRDTHWQRQLDNTAIPITAGQPIRAYLEGLKTFAGPTLWLGEFRGALDRLRTLDTETLQFLLQSTLDLSSHRLDAWITSFATKRLTFMRGKAPVGQYVGGYGWVENLRPIDGATLVPDAALPKGEPGPLIRPADESGFIHAPSMTHAAAAALLRNSHLGPSGRPTADDPFAIELTSQRVREADRLLDGVRQGQPLGALLGYRMERRLHDMQLSNLIAPLRAAAPLAVRDRGDKDVDPKVVAANNVVDGLLLAQRWNEGGDGFIADALPKASEAERKAARHEIVALLDDIDGLGDALTAEIAYQLARGNSSRLGATLAAVAQGSAPPPELEVARTPRTGNSLTHRVVVLLDSAAAAVAGWADPSTSPTATAERQLNAWVSRLLGDPRKARCTVERLADDGKSVAGVVAFPLSELRVTALDFVYAIDDTAAGSGASLSHIEQLAIYNAQRRPGGFGAAGNLRIQPARPADLAAGEATLFDLLEQGRAVRRLLEAARGLRPEDLAPPERPGQGVVDLPGLQARVKAGADALGALHALVDGRLKAGPTATTAETLRTDLLALGAFGLRPAAPCVAVGDTPDIRAQLLRQAAALLPQSAARLAQAAALLAAPVAPDPRQRSSQLLECGKAVFGQRFLMAPSFTCDAAAATEIVSALGASTQQQGGDPLAVHAWFTQCGQVREPIASLARCLRGAEVLGAGERLALSVAQLPFNAAERWVGLKLLPGTELPPSKLSIAVQAGVAPKTQGPFCGLFVDEWVEVVPSASETTALTFQFDPPNSFAPQNILLAVPPVPGQDWTTEALRRVLVETLDLAKLRAVDPALLGAAAQYLPGIYLPFNAAGAAVSTDVAPLTV